MSVAAQTSPPSASSSAVQSLASLRPYLGLAGVLLGAVISTIYGRITVFGLADLRGAVSAGFDEGSWINTASTVGQMLIAPPAVVLGAVYGVRRVLLGGCAVFFVASALLPLSGDLQTLLVLQGVAGVSSGVFVPLTISFVMRSLPPHLQPYGIAVYAMNLELSSNLPASLEGFYLDHMSWRWIFWQHSLLVPVMAFLIWVGVPREPVKQGLLKSADWSGAAFAGVGFALLYAALSQGDRLDWLNSGTIVGLLLSGSLLIVALGVSEVLISRDPFIDFRFLSSGNLPKIALVLALYRFVSLATALLIPQFLTTLQGYRSMEVGSVLLWIALPQFLLAPMVVTVLRRYDARLLIAAGLILIAVACFDTAATLTRVWNGDDFLYPGQILQAIGQSFALTAIIWFSTRHTRPDRALSFGAFVQTTRLFGGEIGAAFAQSFVRIREQVHSNTIGQHVTDGAFGTMERLQSYAAYLLPQSTGPGDALARAAALLAKAVRDQASTLSFVDAFGLLGFAAVFAICLVGTMRAAPAAPH